MTLTAGARLGPYTVERLLGAGGMGEVYQGVDTRLGRAVALKVISQRLVGEADSRRRFASEARAASALNHPAIVTIYDIGESDGLSWIAMELVEGGTLRDLIARDRLSSRRAWSLARQLADGLAAAHGKQIVHRDLKPDNIMVTDDDRVKILDFGLAQQHRASWLDGKSAAATVTSAGGERTGPGAILGTVGYMSPEQAAGRPADFRSDQFSFGAVVYELIAGQKAFARPTAVETLSAIIRDEPPPLTTLRADVSESFARVVARCLEKQPDRRFQSTRELAAAVESLTPDASSARGAATVAGPRHAPLRSTPQALGLLSVGAAFIAAVLFGALWNRPLDTAITAVAVLPFDNVAGDPELEYISDGVSDGIIDHLSRANSLKVMARATVMRFRDRPDPRQVARSLGVGAVVTGALARRGNQIVISAELIHGGTGERLWGETYDRPIADLMRVQDSIVIAITDGLRLRLSGEERARLGGFATNNPEAYELFLKGRYLLQSDTEEDDLGARQLFMQAIDRDPKFVDAYVALASSYARAAGGGYEPPQQANARAEEALEKAAALDPGNVAVRVAMAHQRFHAAGDWAATEREYRAVMNDPAILRSINYHPISLFFVALGRPDEAVALVERALVVDPGNVESRVMLGNFMLLAGRLDDALRVYTAIAAEWPEDSRPLFGAADVYKRRGLYQQAADARRKAYELSGDAESARVFERARTEAEYVKAEIAAARLQLRDLTALAAQRYVPPFDIARLHAQIGNREQALAGLEQALEDRYVGLSLLKVDSAWDSVRTDPRFAAAVRRVGIP